MLDVLDSRQITEWQAFDRLAPVDHAARIELACAIVAQTIANSNKSKDADPYVASDFMRDWGKEFREELGRTPAQIEAEVDVAVAMLGLHWI